MKPPLCQLHGFYRLCAVETLDRQLDFFDVDVCSLAVEGETLPLARPCLEEVVAHDLFAVVSAENDRTRLPLDLSVDHGLTPVPELIGVDVAAFQSEVGVLGTSWTLTKNDVFTVLVLHDFRLGIQALYVLECTLGNTLNLNLKVKITNMVKGSPVRHFILLKEQIVGSI